LEYRLVYDRPPARNGRPRAEVDAVSATVQATCPGCKHVLRIPAEWLGQAFKCKHCGMVIQARPKAAAPKPAAVPGARRAGAPPRPAKPSAGDPFSFEDGDDASPSRGRTRRRSGGGGLVLGLVIGGVVLGAAVIAAVVAWPHLSRMMQAGGQVA